MPLAVAHTAGAEHVLLWELSRTADERSAGHHSHLLEDWVRPEDGMVLKPWTAGPRSPADLPR